MTEADIILAEVNLELPRTLGRALVHTPHFDYIAEKQSPVHEKLYPPITEVEKTIGKLVAENLVEDGATLQAGIGAIPDTVLAGLKNHKNLGIHTEMLADPAVDLVESGIVPNVEKVTDPGLVVATCLIGSKKLYKYVHNNPLISMQLALYTNDDYIIGLNPKGTAINACIELDVLGQSAADCIGGKMFSGK